MSIYDVYIEYVLKCMCCKYGELNIIYQPFYRNTYQAIQRGRSKTLEVAETNERVTNHHPRRVIASIFQRSWKQSVFFCDAPRNQHNKCLVQTFKTRLEHYGTFLKIRLV